jgi:hypothetical protein
MDVRWPKTKPKIRLRTGWVCGEWSSDIYSHTGFTAWKAFNNVQGDEGWHTGYNYLTTDISQVQAAFIADPGGAITTTASATNLSNGTNRPEGGAVLNSSAGNIPGEWLKVELPHKIKLSYAKIVNRTLSNDGQCPKDFKILGSNDDDIWYELIVKQNAGYTAGSTHDEPITNTQNGQNAYKYLAFLCTRINSTSSGSLTISEISLYGHRENDLVRLPDPTNVLKYPHIAMTGPAQRGYVASASSSQQAPYLGFTPATSGQAWVSGNTTDYDGANNDYNATTYRLGALVGGGNTEYGEWLKLELPHKLAVNKMILTADPGGTYGINEAPDAWKIYGSNDDTNWVELLSVTGATPTTSGDTRTISNSTAYKYIAIVITSVNIFTAYTRVGQLEYYGTGVDSIPIQIGGGNIDKVANFRVYDKFVGEDQALEIWDAQKDEFGRAKSSMTLQKGRLGIGTTEPQGRLAVADEPHNLEEFPPRGMTGYKTYFEGHGEFCVSASHEYNSTTGFTWRAFDKNKVSEWQTSGGFFSGGALVGSGLTTITNGIGAGIWLQIECPYKVSLKKFVYSQRVITNRTIKNGYVVGSNDTITWDIVHKLENIPIGEGYKDYHVPVSNYNFYKYFRLITTEVHGGDRTEFTEWRLFGTREQGQSVLHDGQLTLTKSLNVPRIGPALDADDTPRRDRLVVEYNTSTNPTFEGAVRDTSGRGNDGIFVGTASYDATQKSLEFPSNPVAGSTSGTYDSIFAGDIFKRKITQHTTSLWLKPNSMAAWEQIFGIGQNVSVAHEGLWISGTDTLAVHTEGGNPSQQYHYTIGNVNGQWIHVTLVRNSLTFDDHILYVNGIPLTATITSGGTDTMSIPEESDLRIGGRLMGNNNYWLDGSISNFKLWDTALTAEEVKILYDMGRTGSVVNPQPLHIAAPMQVEKTLRIPVDSTNTGVYTVGMIRFNKELGKIQVHDGSGWLTIGGVSATGGVVSYADGYTIHTFTDISGTFTMLSSGNIEYLVVAGGGGGGSRHQGGGGAGGMLTGTYTLPVGTYTIVVGSGGAGRLGSSGQGTTGTDTTALGFTAKGGGGSGLTGGSSGGGPATNNGTSTSPDPYDLITGDRGSQGYRGGSGNASAVSESSYNDGGGGGAGGVGGSATSTTPGDGGVGLQSSISGTSTYYAGGGGGGGGSGGTDEGTGGSGGGGRGGRARAAVDGTDGLGGGGGSGGFSGATNYNGGNGGSGIVIIRYLS